MTRLNTQDMSWDTIVCIDDSSTTFSEGFDVVKGGKYNNLIYCSWVQEDSMKVIISMSINDGNSWHRLKELVSGGPVFFDKYTSITTSDTLSVFLAYAGGMKSGGDSSLAIDFYYCTDLYDWYWLQLIDNPNMKDFDPHVESSNDLNNPAVWVSYTKDYNNSGDYDVFCISALHPDSFQTGGYQNTAIATTVNKEFWGDIENYKIYPNMWVNMTYLVENAGVNEVYYTWSSGSTPSTWATPIQINDYNAMVDMYNLNPKILYSPGSPASGAGIIYARDATGLYFDCPWFSNQVEEDPSTINSNITTNFITGQPVIKFNIPNNGMVEVSIWDLSGRLSFNQDPEFYNQGQHSLNLSNLNSGNYFIELKLNNIILAKSKLTIF